MSATEFFDRGLCRQIGGDFWFPEGQGKSTRVAKKTCLDCEVRQECLQYALDRNESWGVWGGLDERERRRIKRRTRKTA